MDNLLSRYRQLCLASEETSQRCAMIIKAKIIHEKSSQLNTVLANLSNTSIALREVADVRTALQEQQQINERLEKFTPEINDLITRGNELVRQAGVPKYVQQDVQNIQKIYNEKIQSGNDLFNKLKVSVRRKFIRLFTSFFISAYWNSGNVSMAIDVVINNNPND